MSSQVFDNTYNQLFAHEFVTCAGSVLFRRNGAQNRSLSVCVLHDRKTGRYLLPKGRQDCGESIRSTALRETYEETGQKCEFLPVTLVTRATPPDIDVEDEPRETRDCTEPFALTVRRATSGSIKLIYWYITICKSEDATPRTESVEKERTQTASEDYVTEWCKLNGVASLGDDGENSVKGEDSSLSNAARLVARRLSFPKDQELLKAAIEIVGKTYPNWFTNAEAA